MSVDLEAGLADSGVRNNIDTVEDGELKMDFSTELSFDDELKMVFGTEEDPDAKLTFSVEAEPQPDYYNDDKVVLLAAAEPSLYNGGGQKAAAKSGIITAKDKLEASMKLENRKLIEIPIEYFEIQVTSDGCTSLPQDNDILFYRLYIWDNMWAVIGETEKQKNRKEAIAFQTLIRQQFVFGAVQKMKLVMCCCSSVFSDKDPIEIAMVEFTGDQVLMNIQQTTLNASEGSLLKNLIRVTDLKLTFLTSEKDKKPLCAGSGKLSVSMILPGPAEHIVPRKSNDTGSHIIIEDIRHFTDLEFTAMSVTIRFQVEGLKAMGKDLTVDPYFIVFRDGVEFQQKLYQSEVQQNCKGTAVFRIFTFGLGSSRSLDNPMKIEFWHKKQFIGIFTTTVEELRGGSKTFILRDPSVPNENRGNITVLKYEERIWFTELITKKILSNGRTVSHYYNINPFSSLHYFGYHKLHLTLAIDFTASNGQVPEKNKSSYHYCGSKEFNPYEKAMSTVVNAIFQYNDQSQIKLYGFGHLKDSTHQENYQVLLKGPKNNAVEIRRPDDDCLSKVLQAYRQYAKKVKMGIHGEFREIIDEVAEDAMSSHSYAILVIILDGDKVSNMNAYLATLRQSFRSGMSIVFIGIGDERFQNLKVMQSECTNVTFTKYLDDEVKLGIRALRKVPMQLLDYYASRKEVPEVMGHINYFS